MGLDRKKGVQLLSDYFPAQGTFGQGSLGFDHIAKDYTNSGTTCGFPTHWVLWRLGCNDKSLVNRYEPDTDFTYTDSANLSRIYHSHAFVNVLANKTAREQFLSGAIYPKPGDTIFISDGEKIVTVQDMKDGKPVVDSNDNPVTHQEKRYIEHVYQVLEYKSGTAKDKLMWKVANSGQGSVGKQEAQIIDGRGVAYRGGAWYDTRDQRQFYGWLDIDKLSAGTAPKVPKEDPLSFRSSASSAGPPKPENVIGVWKLSNGKYYMFYKGHRVFRLASNNPQMIIDAGFWYPEYGDISVNWESKLALDTIKITGNTAKVRGEDGNLDAVKTITTGTVMSSFHDNRGGAVSAQENQATMAGKR